MKVTDMQLLTRHDTIGSKAGDVYRHTIVCAEIEDEAGHDGEGEGGGSDARDNSHVETPDR